MPFRFIDNLCAIIDVLEIDKNYKDKYPFELELKKKVYQPPETKKLGRNYLIRSMHFPFFSPYVLFGQWYFIKYLI